MLTIKAEVLKKSFNVGLTYNVKIRFTYKRQVKRISTSLFAKPEDIVMRSFKLKEGTPIKQEADKLVAKYQEMCMPLMVDINDYTLEDILRHIKRQQKLSQKIDFIKFSREWIAKATIKGAANYTSAINAFVAFLGKEELDISKLTVKLLKSFAEYLQAKKDNKNNLLIEHGKRPTSNRIVSLYLGSIRCLFNEAQKFYNDYDQDITLIPRSPFDYYQVPRQEATRKRAITSEQIRAIYELPYTETFKGRHYTCRHDLAKDCFIISFCLIGMNSADLYNCTTIEDDGIVYYRTKTKDRRQDNAKMKVGIPQFLIPYIYKYRDKDGKRVFNFYKYYSTASSFNRAINLGLKQIGEELGIEDLEFYAARHSWATIAINQVGIDKYTVHSALNHYDKDMRVTDIYIERDFTKENEANEKVLELVFK